MTEVPLDLLQRLFINNEGFKLLNEMSRGADESFVKDCIIFFEAHKQTIHFLQYIIQSEFEKTESNTVFRGNCFCSRCLLTYTMITHAEKYIYEFFKEPMNIVLTNKIPIETNPEEAKSFEQNIDNLKTVVRKFIDCIVL